MNLSKLPDTDVLIAIVFKLQKRVEVGATTLLIKVKTHRGDPLNEEAEIRAESDRLKEVDRSTVGGVGRGSSGLWLWQ